MIVVREGTQSACCCIRIRRKTLAGRRWTCSSVRWRKTFGPNSLAVILTGMGQDGLRGCEAIREAGGQILAQDEATSVVWGMPGYVARAGLADRVLPLSLIADEIVRQGAGTRPGVRG